MTTGTIAATLANATLAAAGNALLGYPIFANNLWATLASPAAKTDTTLTLTAGQGARLPTIPAGCWIYMTLVDANNDLEVVTVIAVSGDVLTVERAADNTVALAWAAGARIEARFNTLYLTDIKQYIAHTLDSGNYTMTGPLLLHADPVNVNDLLTKQYVDNTLFPKSRPWMAPVGYPMVQNWTNNLIMLTWLGGGNLQLQVDATVLGNLWTSGNFNPNNYANNGAQCPWNSGIVQIGGADEISGGTSDTGSPWVMQGWQMYSNRYIAPRVVYLRNQ